MSIKQPSQYQCDNMKKGDLVIVCNRSKLYKLIRKLFRKNLPKIRVRKSWNNDKEYNTYYQEDCTLLYEYELKCVQLYEKCVPYMFSLAENDAGLYTKLLQTLKIGLQNVQITLDSGITLTIPTQYFKSGIEANERIFNALDDRDKILDSIFYRRYKGSYFKQYVLKNNIHSYDASFCSVCGNPVVFQFNDNDVDVINLCNCGNTKINTDKMSYEDLSIWYASTINESAIKRNKMFWFGDANSNEK